MSIANRIFWSGAVAVFIGLTNFGFSYAASDENMKDEELCNVELFGNKAGYVDKQGRWIVKPQFESAGRFSEGFAPFKRNGKYGYIDSSGKEIIKARYEYGSNFSEGLVYVELKGKKFYIDSKEREITAARFDDATDFSNGLALVYLNEQAGYIDKSGRQIIPFQSFYSADSFHDGLAAIGRGEKKYGFIDKSGREVIPAKFEFVNSFREGLAPFKKNGKWGYIDKTGSEIIPAQYEDVGRFYEGLASFRRNSRWGYIDKTGSEVIPAQFEGASDFKQGLAQVRIGGRSSYINKSAQTVIGNFATAEVCANGLFRVQDSFSTPTYLLGADGKKLESEMDPESAVATERLRQQVIADQIERQRTEATARSGNGGVDTIIENDRKSFVVRCKNEKKGLLLWRDNLLCATIDGKPSKCQPNWTASAAAQHICN